MILLNTPTASSGPIGNGAFEARCSNLGNQAAGCSAPRLNLSNRAKSIRGETSKRIEGLLNEWKDYKQTAEEEIRRISKNEQGLQEVIFQKQREKEEMQQELCSLRSLSIEQKNTITKLSERLECDEKNRARAIHIEMQLNTIKRKNCELEYELKTKTDALNEIQREKDCLIHQNEMLRQTNLEQKNKLDCCDQDVTETQLELEILEEMVKTLNEKKIAITGNNSPPMCMKINRSSTPKPILRNSPLCFAADQKDLSSIRKFPEPCRPMNSLETHINDRANSTLEALKGLQKQHQNRCIELSTRIEKINKNNSNCM